jgi:hypothetical protein
MLRQFLAVATKESFGINGLHAKSYRVFGLQG